MKLVIFITLSYLPISYLCCVSILLIFWCRCTLLSHNAFALQSSPAIANKKDIVGWFLSSLRITSLSFNWVEIEHWYIISCNFISCYWAWPFYIYIYTKDSREIYETPLIYFMSVLCWWCQQQLYWIMCSKWYLTHY